ncbi:MAG TPA: NAD(P)-dependent alcohol dehydrogenase [Solirubrobacteraceae bacterium]|jgi:NAD+-dependent secondary alcohol dehydrogenase Adh1|nr:NAD(P)-dependent alcohol dehydrogenase [Solirubrobacteraceae bacterium]
MKAARLHAYSDDHLHIDEVEEPGVRDPHDVIVRVGGAGLCRTDLHIMEGIWEPIVGTELPYILGHENAGWVEEVGSSVTSVAVGDAVVVHPVVSCGVCRGCRRGEDMYCSNSAFPGLTGDGGFAQYLKTSERSCLKLPPELEPADVAPYADAGITAYRAAKKAAAGLTPGSRCVVIGTGGLGHIGVQSLKALCSAEVIAVDTSAAALELAASLGADHVVPADENVVEAVRAFGEDDGGVEAVIDFVGEHGTTDQGPKMLAQGGTYFVVGYGGRVNIPAIDLIFNEINVVGNLVGSYTELAELMSLAAAGKVELTTRAYPLERINEAIDDFQAGNIQGRAVLVPGQ